MFEKNHGETKPLIEQLGILHGETRPLIEQLDSVYPRKFYES